MTPSPVHLDSFRAIPQLPPSSEPDRGISRTCSIPPRLYLAPRRNGFFGNGPRFVPQALGRTDTIGQRQVSAMVGAAWRGRFGDLR